MTNQPVEQVEQMLAQLENEAIASEAARMREETVVRESPGVTPEVLSALHQVHERQRAMEARLGQAAQSSAAQRYFLEQFANQEKMAAIYQAAQESDLDPEEIVREMSTTKGTPDDLERVIWRLERARERGSLSPQPFQASQLSAETYDTGQGGSRRRNLDEIPTDEKIRLGLEALSRRYSRR